MEEDGLVKNPIPKKLLEIPQPPKRLYVRGNLNIEDKKILVVVGSRKHTSYGADTCRKLITSLQGLPVVIVSGLSYGIDAIAHEAALDCNLTTIAFPGSGLSDEVLYPAQNRKLAKRILENGGALVSELEPNTKADIWTFPRRNRLTAGISDAVLIIEAEQKSGTLITARLATEYNRDVLAVPGNINSPTSVGTNMLIRLGATPITCPDDLREALGFERNEQLTTKNRQLEMLENLTDEERKLVDLLREPKSRDELIRELGISASDFNMTLTMLEIKGVIKEELGTIRVI